LRALGWVLALVTSADLILTGGNRPMNAAPGGPDALTASETAYQRDAGALQRLRQLVQVSAPPVRTDYADVWAPGILAGGMLGMPTADGHIPFMLRRMLLLRRIFTDGKPTERNRPVSRLDSPLLRMLNTGFVGTLFELPADRASSAGLTKAGSYAGLTMYRVPGPLPRFYLVPELRRSADEAETFRLLARPDFDPAAEAVVEGAAGGSGLGAGSVKVLVYEPDFVRLEVQAQAPGFLASSETLYPGWTATLNGAGVPLVLTNGVFRGLSVPGGRSEIVMTYRPDGLVPSGAVSLSAWSALALLAFI